MFERVLESLENFCIHQIRLEHRVFKEIPKSKTIIASIDLTTQDGVKNRFFLASSEGFAQKIAMALLEEDQSDEQTLVDMVLESANLVVGSAKVLLSEKDMIKCSISTPTFHKHGEFDLKHNKASSLDIDGDIITIAIEENI